jgi:hypothetical protein
MDFPVFHLDILGNRALIAIIAILHVLINHGLAVGMMPLVACMEWYGVRKQDPTWDRLAYKILFVSFIVTTTLGALTGVGIWLSVSLVNPYSIGSLIRVFFWAWFVEWLVFITEVCLILAYTLTWKKWRDGAAKRRHIRLGFALAIFSWITMAIIVSILGFMMDPGNWLSDSTLLAGFTNPMYLPQLAFRTPLAAAMAGVIALFLVPFFVGRDDPFRQEAMRAIALWTLLAAPLVLLGGWWYYEVVPAAMKDNLAVSTLTLQFSGWLDELLTMALVTVIAIVAVVQLALSRPRLVAACGIGRAFRRHPLDDRSLRTGPRIHPQALRGRPLHVCQRPARRRLSAARPRRLADLRDLFEPAHHDRDGGGAGRDVEGGARRGAGPPAAGQGRLHECLLALPHDQRRECGFRPLATDVRRPDLESRSHD